MVLSGVDISNWQQGFDVAKCAGDFMIAKATEGTTYVDPYCDGFIQQAKKAGIPYGVYHFWRRGGWQSQADFFVENVKGYVKSAILVLDWEDVDTYDVGSAKGWLDEVYRQTGVKPLIYMSGSTVKTYNWDSVINGDYGLWVADWSSHMGSYSWGETGPIMWQFTDSYPTPCDTVDGDQFFGTVETWHAYAGSSGAAPEPAPKPPTPKAPKFPLPSGHYFGPAEGPAESHSGYYSSTDSDNLAVWQDRMNDRGWTIDPDGLYGPVTENVATQFQQEKDLSIDGLIGSETWGAAWTEPIT